MTQSGLLLPPVKALVRDERCERCKYAAPSTNQQGALDCRRFPPSIAVPQPGALVALFPVVDPTMWCGCWERKIVTNGDAN